MATAMISRLKVMASLNIVERRHAQDGRISIMHHNRPRDLRVGHFPTIYGEKIVIRIHEVLTALVGFSHLGMSQEQAEAPRSSDLPALWGRAGGRAGRRGQDLDPVQLPGTDQLAPHAT